MGPFWFFMKRIALTFFIGLFSLVTFASDAPSNSTQTLLKPQWHNQLSAPFNKAPIIGEQLIYAAPSDGSLNALDQLTGKTVWSLPVESIWDRGVTLHDDILVVCYRDASVVGLDSNTGRAIWKTSLGDLNCQRDSVAVGDDLYVSTTYVGPGLKGSPLTGAKLFKLNRHTGQIQWSLTTDTFLLQTASVDGDQLFVGGSFIDPSFTEEEGGPAYYYLADTQTGIIQWRAYSEDGLPKTLFLSGGVATYIAYQDFVQALDVATGKPLWRRDTENWVSAFLGQDETLYFGSANTFVHAWNVRDGAVNWRYNMPGSSFEYLLVAPRLVADSLWFLSQKGQVFSLDAKSGALQYTAPTGVVSRIEADFKSGKMAVGDLDGKVYLFELPSP